MLIPSELGENRRMKRALKRLAHTGAVSYLHQFFYYYASHRVRKLHRLNFHHWSLV